MTHTPTLPNGFSRDFSEAPRGVPFIGYFDEGDGEGVWGIAGFMGDEMVWFDQHNGFPPVEDRPLCWCPIPTPGHDVLKELAEEGK